MYLVCFPPLFQKFLAHTDYRKLFFFSQFIYVTAELAKVCLATRFNTAIGIPDLLLYFLSGTFAMTLERTMTIMPSHIILAKVTPPGIEASMIALSTTIIQVN